MHSLLGSYKGKKMNHFQEEILKQWIDVLATVLAGFMFVCILAYIAMNHTTIDVGTLDILVIALLVLGLFIFFVFPTCMNPWEKLKAFFLGGIYWTCPACKKEFYGEWKLERLKQDVIKHITSIHGFTWDFSKSFPQNLTRFTNMKGGKNDV